MVGILMTAVVYGAVALIVKMDDIGLHLAERESAASQRIGRGLVKAMPSVLEVIYLVFNEGYLASSGESASGPDVGRVRRREVRAIRA